MGGAAVTAVGHPDVVAQAAGGSEDGSDGVVHRAHCGLNDPGSRPMPGPAVASATPHRSASTAWYASRMHAGTPTPRNAAPAIASPGTALTAARTASTRSW